MSLLWPLLAAVAVGFVVLALLRFGGARRGQLANNWPAIVFTLAAVVALMRGGLWIALAMGAAAGLAWAAAPTRAYAPPPPPRPTADPGDAEARALLGVKLHASDEEIRAAYRAKMAEAHPDRGGSHAEAARLSAARDRLLARNRRS